MAAVWFWLLASALAIYAVLDGFDFGVGILHWFVGRAAAERETVLRSIGPVWDGNEVWLIAAGGTSFAAFPVLYSTVFSGFYLPLTLVLWLLLLRALGIELRHQGRDRLWHDLWDAVFGIASALLALFLGAALGNLVRGLPLDEAGEFFEPLWTDFRVGEHTGILDWYTLLVGVTAAFALAHHGALWLNLRLSGELAARARRYAARLWLITVPLAIVTTVESALVQPRLVTNLTRCPQGALLPLAAALGLASARWFLNGAPKRAFVGSALFIAGLVLSAAYAIFPYALAARIPERAMTLSQAAAQPETLRGMLLWWVPGMALAASYSFFIYSRLPGSIAPDREDH